MSDALDDCFLGVEKSLTGKRWLVKEADGRAGLAISQRLYLPEIVGRVMAARGVGLEDAGKFINPTLRDLLPDPSRFKDMDAAVARLAAAVTNGETIAVFGDYDVDGATSAALLGRYFRALGIKLLVHIPDRLAEGYGPNIEALTGLKAAGASVVVTADCGTTATEPLRAARDAGIDVIVVDHHEAEPLLPPAVAVVNPNRLDEDRLYGHMAAVGVVFLLLVGLNRALRKGGAFKDRSEPDLMQWLDLVALGSVCDVVPLTGVNRALVAQGLKVMGRRANAGLRALADIAGLGEAPGTYHAGFIFGPRINAGGRIGTPDLGYRLLATDDPGEAAVIAGKLDEFNRQRQDIEARILADAMDRIEKDGMEEDLPIVVAGEGWHPGVVGIVASRVSERFNRPSCVVYQDGEAAGGSGRSVSGVDLGSAVIAARQAGIIAKGGGHEMAAGFSLASDKVGEFRSFLARRMAPQMKAVSQPRGLYLDGGLEPSAVSMKLVSALGRCAPFGMGNPEPRFALPAVHIDYADAVGKDKSHVRLTISGGNAGRLNAIAFRAMETALGPALMGHDGAAFHIAGKIRENVWQGRSSAQLIVDDAAPVW